MTKRDGTGRARTLGIAALSLGLVAGCGKSDRPLADVSNGGTAASGAEWRSSCWRHHSGARRPAQ